MSFATVENLEERWRDLTPTERERARVLLMDASEMLRRYEEADDYLLMVVSCNMVKRAMETNGDAFGIDGQITPSQGWAESLPVGRLKPEKWELDMLRRHSGIVSIRAQR